MKQALKAAVTAAALATATVASATPSTDFWSPATTYVQPYLVPHLTYDTYFGEKGAYPIDTGITIGVLPWEKLQGEIGFDLLYPLPSKASSSALLLNAKLVIPEGAFGEAFPGLSAGVANVGFTKNVTDLTLLHGEIGKTFGPVGNFTVGGYYGVNKYAMFSTAAKVPQGGAMLAWYSPDINVKVTGLDKITFMADAMTGKNNFGAVGVGIGFYFTPSIDVLTGPVFFQDKGTQPGGSSMLWTVQLDVDFDLRPPAPPAPAPKT
jgi:hypothetical protein